MNTAEGGSSFYANADKYLAHLRRNGRVDYAFEDEFFFTMPALSGSRS